MVNNTPLILPEELLTYVDISENLQSGLLDNTIIQAQDKYIKPVLGRKLFLAIQEDVEEENDVYEDLLPYIKKALAYFVQVEFMTNKIVSLTAAGVQEFNSEYSSNAQLKAAQLKMSSLNGSAENAVSDMVAFLTENETEYPLWQELNRKNNRTSSDWLIA